MDNPGIKDVGLGYFMCVYVYAFMRDTFSFLALSACSLLSFRLQLKLLFQIGP